jgi:hypothetical protein
VCSPLTYVHLCLLFERLKKMGNEIDPFEHLVDNSASFRILKSDITILRLKADQVRTFMDIKIGFNSVTSPMVVVKTILP